MAFENGDFIEVEYSAWDASDNSLIATTDEEKAKKANLYDEKARYGKVLVVVGSNGIISGLDRELHGMSVGEQKKFTFKPEEAFGQRDEQLVRVMRLADFRERNIEPYPGLTVELDDRTAIVRSVNSGRVIVDANNQYAGRNIVYEVKVVSHVTKDEDKVRSLGSTYGAAPTEVAINGSLLSVKYGSGIRKDADFSFAKARTVASAFSYLKAIDNIKVEEDYNRKELDKEAIAHGVEHAHGHAQEHKHGHEEQ